MSYKITADGSPTPRKGVGRFSSLTDDLKLDTSTEALGPVGARYRQYPSRQPLGPLLTSNFQTVKRTALQSLDSFKVGVPLWYPHIIPQ